VLQGARLTRGNWPKPVSRTGSRSTRAAPALIARGLVDCVVVGATGSRVNGDNANKIGTYFAGPGRRPRRAFPFVVVAPESTVDPDLPTAPDPHRGRHTEEVTTFAGHPTAPAGTQAFNPAFDVSRPT